MTSSRPPQSVGALTSSPLASLFDALLDDVLANEDDLPHLSPAERDALGKAIDDELRRCLAYAYLPEGNA
jgi:hypothetical protein